MAQLHGFSFAFGQQIRMVQSKESPISVRNEKHKVSIRALTEITNQRVELFAPLGIPWMLLRLGQEIEHGRTLEVKDLNLVGLLNQSHLMPSDLSSSHPDCA